MLRALAPSAALLLVAGCVAAPPPASRAVYYVPHWSPPAFENDPPGPFYSQHYPAQSLSSAARGPAAPAQVPVNAPLPGIPAGDDCGWWRLCNLPGWRYEN